MQEIEACFEYTNKPPYQNTLVLECAQGILHIAPTAIFIKKLY